MDDFPEVRRCCGVFPVKHATYLISVFGLGCGGVAIAGLVLYALIDHSTLRRSSDGSDQAAKMSVMVLFVTSVILVLASLLLFCGVLGKSSGTMLSLAIFLILAMCGIWIFSAITPPLACFFAPKQCPLKNSSYASIVLIGIILTFFISAWVYFAVVVGNHVLNV